MAREKSDGDFEELSKAKPGYKLVKSLFGKYAEIPEDWEFVRFGNVSKIKRGASPRPIQDPKYFGNGRGWIRISDVSKSNKYLEKTRDYLSKEGESESVVVNEGDIIMSIAATVGRPIILKMKACIHDGFIVFAELSKEINNEFLYYLLETLETSFSNMGQHGTQSNINSKLVSDRRFVKPSLPEQEKIASILSNLDNVISIYDDSIDSSKKLKTGLMQQLLTKGIGRKKFKKIKWYFGKELEIPEDWENVNIGYVADKLLSGGTPSTEIPLYWEGKIPWTKGAVLTKSDTISGERFITESGLKNSSTSIIPKDNLLVVSRVSIGNVSINKIDIAINQDVTAIILNKSLCMTEFLYWNLLYTIGTLVSFSQGTTIQGFTRRDLSNHKVLLPSLEEQQKIASILSEVDKKIYDLELKKLNLENLKKGLMQQLLTGKIPVKV